MKAHNRDQFVVLQYLSDGLGVGAGLLMAFWLRFSSGLDPAAVVSTNYIMQFWWAFLLWMLCLQFSGAFQAHPRVISFNRARRILRASAMALMLIAVRNYFFRDSDVARLLYPLSFVSVAGCIVANRMLLQVFISRFMMTKGVKARVLIAGVGSVGLRLAARFRTQQELGYQLVGFVSLGEHRVGQSIGGVPVLGMREDLRRLVRDNEVDEVFVTQTDIPADSFFQLFLDTEKETARISFVPSLMEMMRSTVHYDEVAGVPVYSMRETPLQGTRATLKRGFDMLGASFGLLLISPILLLITILVKRSSPGPVLYKQTRLGLDGKEFNIYKFRTMPVDAERNGAAWGTQEDPRATPFGKWLRMTNLDELPQLWNVLRGDMSLVGPRPERPYFVEQFREMFPRYMARHAVKTGMTGWAQVHGLRGNTSIQQRLRYDLYYIENWSLWLDIKILIMTFFMPKKRRTPSLRQQPQQAPVSAELARTSTASQESNSKALQFGGTGGGPAKATHAAEQ